MVLRKWESRSSPPKESKARANARALFVIIRRPGSPELPLQGIVLIVIIVLIVVIVIIVIIDAIEILFSSPWIECEQSYKQS